MIEGGDRKIAPFFVLERLDMTKPIAIARAAASSNKSFSGGIGDNAHIA
jgi:hypothetical protein